MQLLRKPPYRQREWTKRAAVEPGIDMVLEVTAPAAHGCWVLTVVAVHYHVGIRHYTATPGSARRARVGSLISSLLAVWRDRR